MADRSVTDTWETSPAKRELVDCVHRMAAKLAQAELRLGRVRDICEQNDCDVVARQIRLFLDGQDTPLAALLIKGGTRSRPHHVLPHER